MANSELIKLFLKKNSCYSEILSASENSKLVEELRFFKYLICNISFELIVL